MSKYYNINNLFDENGEPVKVTLKIKRKNNQIDYKTAYEATYDAFNHLYRRYKNFEEIIKEINDYIDKVEILATVDKVNIFSMQNLKQILKKVDEIE